jgi:hypothetical protein
LEGFAYSAANEGIIELRSKEELQLCDLSNPIRMYTGGLDKVKLDAEGTRYFASSRLENCRNGLKLHVEVAGHGAGNRKIKVDQVVATGPMPSISVRLESSCLIWLIVALICFISSRPL